MKEWLEERGIPFQYEPKEGKVKFVQPAKNRTYNPDFVLSKGTIIETKGRFDTSDRQKHLLIKEQHPDITVYFVFENANAKLSKRSQTTYRDWCLKNGFECCTFKEGIPDHWLTSI